MRLILSVLLFGMQGCVTIDSGSLHQQALHHVVLCWLKEPGNVEQRKQIVEVSKSFRKIPGVLDIRVGQVVASDRAIVDDSYDVAILVVVPDQKSLDEYLAHPVHQKAKNDILVPLVDKILVYDFKE